VSSQNTGRHRAPSPLSPASCFSLAISRSAKPASKASAVIVISGAMVASLALPASAAAPAAKVKVAAPVALSAAAAPSAAQAPLVPRTFGKIGFTGVVKPKPVAAPVVRPRAAVSVSRSTRRTAVSPTTTPAPARAVVAPVVAPSSSGVLGIAASLAGIYYVYGGESTAGFDCSGYTQFVFAKVGISLPRTAEEQRRAVQSVSDPRPGDLVFFGSPAYHVGIYAGNGMMWDSPQTGSAIALRAIWSSNPSYGRP
jgi:peptidoglycan DL-endopeptidase CwlO